MVSASASPTSPSIDVLQTALADQTELLQGWQTRIESFLERAEAALSRLSFLPATFLATQTPLPHVGSTEDEGADPYGCFSPRVRDNSSLMSAASVVHADVGESIAVLAAPVLQLMPELRDICSSPASPLSLKRLEVDSSATLCEGHVSPLSCEKLETPKSIVSMVPMGDDVEAVGMLALDPLEPNQPLIFVEHGGSDVVVTHSHVTVGQVSVRDKVNDILFDLELHSLLKRLERVSPGSGKAIVEEALRSKGKKSDATRKASAAA